MDELKRAITAALIGAVQRGELAGFGVWQDAEPSSIRIAHRSGEASELRIELRPQ